MRRELSLKVVIHYLVEVVELECTVSRVSTALYLDAYLFGFEETTHECAAFEMLSRSHAHSNELLFAVKICMSRGCGQEYM